MFRLHLVFDQFPASLNTKLRSHYFSQRRESKVWQLIVKNKARGKIPPSPLLKAKIMVIRHAHRNLDFDGLVGAMKPVVDALVRCKIIHDDNWTTIGAWDVDQVFRPKKDGQLLEVIVIEDTMP